MPDRGRQKGPLMGRRGIWFAVLIGVGMGGCGGEEAPRVQPVDGVYSVSLMATSTPNLPTCNATLAGTVAYVSSPPGLWACYSSHWNQLACAATNAGTVAYSSSPQMLWACISATWTEVALPA